jgi:hypothetical protein
MRRPQGGQHADVAEGGLERKQVAPQVLGGLQVGEEEVDEGGLRGLILIRPVWKDEDLGHAEDGGSSPDEADLSRFFPEVGRVRGEGRGEGQGHGGRWSTRWHDESRVDCGRRIIKVSSVTTPLPAGRGCGVDRREPGRMPRAVGLGGRRGRRAAARGGFWRRAAAPGLAEVRSCEADTMFGSQGRGVG